MMLKSYIISIYLASLLLFMCHSCNDNLIAKNRSIPIAGTKLAETVIENASVPNTQWRMVMKCPSSMLAAWLANPVTAAYKRLLKRSATARFNNKSSKSVLIFFDLTFLIFLKISLISMPFKKLQLKILYRR